jgi:antitoxin component of RelBE/YafQ-DinJ toxin-antitoxin module
MSEHIVSLKIDRTTRRELQEIMDGLGIRSKSAAIRKAISRQAMEVFRSQKEGK